ncbi:layilin [Spinachia spinachia]
MNLLTIFCPLLLLCLDPSAATSPTTADIFEARGQRGCKAEKGRPCYKLGYFSELRRRLNFVEAELTCRRDGGQLLSVESESEQNMIEQLITELKPTDGDFWIGLRRNHGDGESTSDCSSQYYWLDGSKSTFRKWHWDEPSCGYEVCVVMYHQPSAPPDLGGLYMFQWNDDNCETKNNFICKYTTEIPLEPSPSPNSTKTDNFPPSALPWNPIDHNQDGNRALHWIYIITFSISLILLLLTAIGVCCFKLPARRSGKQQKSEVCQTEAGLCPDAAPNDVYKVIHSQKDDDLLSARPQTKNTSFLCSSPDTSTGDYDNLAGRDTESGFVTLASTESGFLNFDHNDLSLGRRATRDFCNSSLGRSGKRDLNASSLRSSGQREFYDRSLGRRTTKSEHYGSSLYGDHGLYDGSVRGLSDLYDQKLRPGSNTGRADLYQTYITHGKEDAYQTNLGTYGNRKSYQASLDFCRTGVQVDVGRRYFNEKDWINRENY